VKLVFSPVGLAVVALLAAVVFLPRRMPDSVRRLGKPMRAFDEEEPQSSAAATGTSGAPIDEAKEDRSRAQR
jgi:Sec-independent protein translocase protein TatA